MTVPVRSAVHISATGVVQGVGFRPFIHRLALRHGLGGWVRNESGEVRIFAEGPGDAIAAFLAAISVEAPPLARIERLETRPANPGALEGFRIVESRDAPGRRQPISPDVALCADCERELFDPLDRRHRYPFITCTDCGPRFTVIGSMPYDRERTSMGVFRQCAECLEEYEDPGDRRYHSETNSCPVCGPRVWVRGAGGGLPAEREGQEAESAVRTAARALQEGKIVAIRGLGGFHLAVDATDEGAVRRLRDRKRRRSKPLALMVRTLQDARKVGSVGKTEEVLLTSPERPIVLLRALPDSGLAPSIAPGLDTVGVMTAYTPLHHLLLELVDRPLVMTSGNLSEEPIATGNPEAMERLGRIADLFLLHDREIVARYDDSLVRSTGQGPIFLRRARGYAPLPLDLPIPSPVPLVAVGPHLKNTFTLVHGSAAYVSQHIGDLESLETMEHFREALARFRTLFRITPEAAVRDLHPGYLSSRLAEELGLGEPLAVQHHHAHVAAVAAEHGVTGRVIGIAYDGTGYGDDGAVWGAEGMVADLTSYERVFHLCYAPLPGGDLAARHPWRAALGYLALEPEAASAFSAAFDGIPDVEMGVARQQLRAKLNAPRASSMGRLFDAAAAVLGVRKHNDFEGQAAMELEALAGSWKGASLPLPVMEDPRGGWLLNPLPLLVALGEARARGRDARELAAGFHDAVARATAEVAHRVARETGLGRAVVGGGVFQNARLLDSTARSLTERGLEVLVPRRLSPNDGSISYGQAAIAAAVFQSNAG